MVAGADLAAVPSVPKFTVPASMLALKVASVPSRLNCLSFVDEVPMLPVKVVVLPGPRVIVPRVPVLPVIRTVLTELAAPLRTSVPSLLLMKLT